jgi:hypothetical protein
VREAASQMVQLEVGAQRHADRPRHRGEGGKDPQGVQAGDLAQGEAVTIGADDAEESSGP